MTDYLNELCVGCQNHRSILLAMKHLAQQGFIPETELMDMIRYQGFDKEFYMDQHNWTNLKEFNQLLISCGDLILRYHSEVDPYALIGSLVHDFWELLAGPLADSLRVSKGPGYVYDKLYKYTMMFNVMREIYVVNKTRNSRVIINFLGFGIDAATEDPSYSYITHGILRYGITKLLWGLPPAEIIGPEIKKHDIVSYLGQNTVYPRFDIKAELNADGQLIIDDKHICGQVVELQAEEVIAQKKQPVSETAYLGAIKDSRVKIDHGVDRGKLTRGEKQHDGRQLAVLITEDFFQEKSLQISQLPEAVQQWLEQQPDKDLSKTVLGKRKQVLSQGEIYNAPYHVTHLSYQLPNLVARTVSLVQTSDYYGEDLKKTVDNNRKLAKIIMNFKVMALPAVLPQTIVRIMDKVSDTFEDEMINANMSALERQKALEELQKVLEELRQAKQEIEEALDDMFKVLGKAIEARDPYTEGHTARVAIYAIDIGQVLQLSNSELRDLKNAAHMHDVGKIGTPDSILLKPGKLDNDEFKIMQQHPEIGYTILTGSRNARLRRIAEITAAHHENLDGTGYPFKLKEDQIVFLALIIKAADIYDALTTDRPYRPAYNADHACTIMLQEQIVGLCVSTEIFLALIKTVNPDFLTSTDFAKTCLNVYHGIFDEKKEFKIKKQYLKDSQKYKEYALKHLNMIQPEYLSSHPGCLEAPS